MPGKRMTRLAEAESLRRIENAARTTGEFQEVCEWYDKLDGNRERRERDHEIGTGEYKLLNTAIGKRNRDIDPEKKEAERENGYSDGAVIPPPLATEYWRELMRGDFIGTIFDNADEVWQVFGDWQVGRLIKDLTAKQRDVLFRSAVRECSAERIAGCTNKTKRGVNKLISAALDKIRSILAEKVRYRVENELP
jgi:DNA-directed RNA polymerase specialized sigma24 family protein